MAAPNLLNPTTITGETNHVALTDTSATVVLNNAASSGKLLKVVQLRVTNVDGTNAAAITLSRNTADDGAGTAYRLASTIDVPADAAIDLITGDAPVFLEEDQSLVATASAGNDLEVVVSYLDIS